MENFIQFRIVVSTNQCTFVAAKTIYTHEEEQENKKRVIIRPYGCCTCRIVCIQSHARQQGATNRGDKHNGAFLRVVFTLIRHPVKGKRTAICDVRFLLPLTESPFG